MAQNKSFTLGPLALTNTYTTNILNPAAASGGVNGGSASQKITLRYMRVANKGAAAATFRLWKGATGANAAGTELAYDVSVAVGAIWESYAPIEFTSADFLVGGASAATTLTIYAYGEIGVA